MSNYNQQDVAGAKWSRCKQIIIENKYGSNPSLMMLEEEIISVGGQLFSQPGRSLSASFDAVNGSIPLINPETGSPLGASISHTDLYVILHSLYLQQATIYDAALASFTIINDIPAPDTIDVVPSEVPNE